MTIGIARLKITLDDKPVVLRQLDVPFDIKLDRLRLTIQAAMGWTTAIPTNCAPATSGGARLIRMQIGASASSSMPARLGLAISSKRSE